MAKPRTSKQIAAEKVSDAKWASKVLVRLNERDDAHLANVVERMGVSKPEAIRLALRELAAKANRK